MFMNEYKCLQITMNVWEWLRLLRMFANGNEWLRMIMNDNEWLQMAVNVYKLSTTNL